jgi:secondary thiamine-phosphate synthase enzyme
MTRSSTTTVRERPIASQSEAAGPIRIYARTLTAQTTHRMELVDLTARMGEVVRESGIAEGVVHLWSLHTTCALLVNEYQRALLADITRVLEDLVERNGGWMHNDPEHSDCDRANADAHLRAMLLGHSLTLQVSGGEPVLGQWQRVLLAELDGPRTRSLRIQITGV